MEAQVTAPALSQFSSFLQPVIERGKGLPQGNRTMDIDGKPMDMKVYTHSNAFHLYNDIKEFVGKDSYMVAVYLAPKGSVLIDISGEPIETTESFTPIVVLMTEAQANATDANTYSLQKGVCSFTSVSVVNLFTNSFNPKTVPFNEHVLDTDGSTKLNEDGTPVTKVVGRKNSLAFNMVAELEGSPEYVKAYMFELIGEVAPTPERIRQAKVVETEATEAKNLFTEAGV